MDFHQAVEYVEQSNEFRSFFIDKHDFVLAHGFLVVEQGKAGSWEVGYYSRSADKIVVFVADTRVIHRPEEEAFKKEGHVPSLDVSLVDVSFSEANAKAQGFRESTYPREVVSKTLAIIQSIDGVPTWNLTLISSSFNMLNIRIDATTGQIIAHQLTSIMNLGSRA